MKSAWIVAVVVCVVLTSGVWAQTTARSLGMGATGVGVADDAAAWFQNPAGLGALNLKVQDEKLWANAVDGTYVDWGDEDGFAIDWSGWQPAKLWGVGAGFASGDDENDYGAGFGATFKNTPFSWGVNVMVEDPDPGSTNTYFNVGLMYRFVQPEKEPVRLGLLVRDLTDESNNGPFLDLGVAWPATDKLLVAVDFNDVTDEVDTQINAGVEYKFGLTNEWAGRAGMVDNGDGHDLTLGAGYSVKNWHFDAAWVSSDPDNTWSVSAGVNF
jgi:hypothetical protein